MVEYETCKTIVANNINETGANTIMTRDHELITGEIKAGVHRIGMTRWPHLANGPATNTSATFAITCDVLSM